MRCGHAKPWPQPSAVISQEISKASNASLMEQDNACFTPGRFNRSRPGLGYLAYVGSPSEDVATRARFNLNCLKSECVFAFDSLFIRTGESFVRQEQA